MGELTILGLSPAILLLVLVGILLFMKVVKWAILALVIALLYVAAVGLGIIPPLF